jgi:hypothetical protein
MTSLVSFPSRHARLEYILSTDQRRLRTINDHRDLVADGLYILINAGHPLVYGGHSLVDTGYPVVDASHFIVDAGHLIVDIEYLIFDTSYFVVDSTRSLQNLYTYYPDLFICQLVQPLQRIFNVSLSSQLFQVFF